MNIRNTSRCMGLTASTGRTLNFSYVSGKVSLVYEHDLVGNVTQMEDYDGSITLYEYDALNRLTKINYPDWTGASFTYDALSRLLTATTWEGASASGTVTYSYDNRGRVSSVTDVWGYTVGYEYDNAGNKTYVSVSSGGTLLYKMTYSQYDDMNRLQYQYDTLGNSAEFQYDDVGKLTARALNNAFTSTYGYDGLNRLTGIGYKFNSGNLSNISYTYNDAVNIAQMSDWNGTHTYQYDGKSQLMSATHSAIGLENEEFVYTGLGTNFNADWTFPPGGIKYRYDINGYLQARIDDLTSSTNMSVEYKYDALGRLVGRRESGGLWTKYTYDGEDVIMDTKPNGAFVFYGNGPGMDDKLWYTEGGSPVFFLTDHLGSTRALVSISGATLGTITYDSFGKPLAISGTIGTRFLYAGRDYDADTELYYYRARWYDPQARRFISEDPIGLNGGINLYAYVGNNPMNRIDPWGLRDVDVYIWDWRGLGVVGDGSVGHVMITEHNSSQVILSLFPEPRGISGANTPYNVINTRLKMGRSYDRMYVVNFPNDEAFDRVAADHRTRSTWNWSPTGNDQTHCTRSAYDALKAGGVPLSGFDSGQILPRILDSLLEELSTVYGLQKSFNTTKGWGVTKQK